MKDKREKNKFSARRKLIPAISMLTVSAIMLSTATYAWFTLSKDAKVEGLNMQATAGGSLEISLGSIGEETTLIPTVGTPSMKDKSWKSAIKFSDYYSTIGKLEPASSNTGLSIYNLEDASNVYAGGRNVEESAKTVLSTQKDSATLSLATTYASTTNGGKLLISDTDSDKGYFVDIPMWIRTPAQSTTTQIKCAAVIKDTSSPDKQLKNAVRVAVIPMKSKAEASDAAKDDTNLKLSENASASYSATSTGNSTLTSGGNANIFALNNNTYTTGGKAISTASDDTHTTYSSTLGTVATVDANSTFDTKTDSNNKYTNVFTLPAADTNETGQYSVGGFVVRVWLEGESTSCNDATAGQDWTIDLHFTTATP